MPSPISPMEGQVLKGTFEVQSVLGRGGMGVVYKGIQRPIGRPVAIKILPKNLSHDPTLVTRFLREAKMLAELSHPNVISLFDFGRTDDGSFFLVTEFLDGQPLNEAIPAATGLSVQQTLHILRQIVAGLSAAHAKRILHRDLKPANIFLLHDEQQTVKLLDFGIAKSMDDATNQLTKVGSLLGTPGFMAPEQISGGEVSPRTDVYGLAALTTMMLTGRPPYIGPTATAVLAHQLRRPPDIIDWETLGKPATLDPVLRKALSIDAAIRYDNVEAFLSEIEKACLAPKVQPRKSSKRIRILAASCLVLALGIGTLMGIGVLPAPTVLSGTQIRGVDRKTILLGTSLPLTGSQERLGRGIRAGIQAAMQGANDRGGIHRRQLRLIALDDQSSPHRALRNMHELVEQRGVFAILGGASVEAAKAIGPISHDADLPVFGFMNGSSILRGSDNSLVLNFGADFATQAQALIAHLQTKENISLEQMAIVAETSEMGDAVVEGWQAAHASQPGDAIVIRSEVGKSASLDIIKNIIEKKITAVVLVANVNETEEFSHQLAMLSPKTILATLASADFELVFEALKKSNERRHVAIRNISISPPPTSSLPLVINYRKDLQQYFPEESPSYPSLYGYIAASITFQMMRHMPRSFKPEQVRAYIKHPSVDDIGLIPAIRFDPDRRALIAKSWLATINPNAIDIEYEPLP